MFPNKPKCLCLFGSCCNTYTYIHIYGMPMTKALDLSMQDSSSMLIVVSHQWCPCHPLMWILVHREQNWHSSDTTESKNTPTDFHSTLPITNSRQCLHLVQVCTWSTLDQTTSEELNHSTHVFVKKTGHIAPCTSHPQRQQHPNDHNKKRHGNHQLLTMQLFGP